MLSLRILICRSELFTVFTVVLRCTVNRLRLMYQRVEGCIYGFYGVKVYTPYIYNIKKIKNMQACSRA